MYMQISVIIPAYNEAENIGCLINHVKKYGGDSVVEILVVDGDSKDNTIEIASQYGVNALLSPQKGRAAQMNYGAGIARGDIFYFIHADVLPPTTFVTDIQKAIRNGYDFGRYFMRFDSKKWYLRINEFFTRFDFFICYGGDQTLFITRKLFEETEGFKSDMLIMEDFEFTKRARKLGRYKIFNKAVLISARKYDTNSWWRVQMANKKIVDMYRTGASQVAMVEKYREMLNYR